MNEVSETEKNGGIHLLVPATELGLVRARLDCNVGDDRPVATRLESLEDMVKGVVEKLARMETNQARAVRVQQPQPTVQPQVVAAPVSQGGQQQNYAAAAAAGLTFPTRQVQQLLANRQRRNSVKRSVSGAPRDTDGNVDEGSEDVFTDVVNKKKKKKEVSTGKATLAAIPGVDIPLQASYQNFVGNAPGNMEQETMELV